LAGFSTSAAKLLADAILHEADLLPLDQFAFGLGGAPFGLAGLLGYLRQLGLGNRRLARKSSDLMRPFPAMNDDPGKSLAGMASRANTAAPPPPRLRR